MRRHKTAGVSAYRQLRALLQPHLALAGMTAIAALPLFLLASLLPRPLVLPVLCLIAIGSAAIVACIAWSRNSARDSQHVTAWDVAGALAFIGFAAAMLSDPEQAFSLANAATSLNRTN
jgi:hypothetical protein